MWRVFSCSTYTSDEVIVQAALEAVDVGVDIISLSLGDTVAWPETFGGIVLSRIAANGTKGNQEAAVLKIKTVGNKLSVTNRYIYSFCPILDI